MIADRLEEVIFNVEKQLPANFSEQVSSSIFAGMRRVIANNFRVPR